MRREGMQARCQTEDLAQIPEIRTVATPVGTKGFSPRTFPIICLGPGHLPLHPSASPMPPLLQSQVPGFPCRRGKVRDVYDLGDRLVIVATDRISAVDWILPTGIPDQGR